MQRNWEKKDRIKDSFPFEANHSYSTLLLFIICSGERQVETNWAREINDRKTDTKNALCTTIWIRRDVSSGYQCFYLWLAACYMQETGNDLIIVCGSLSSCNTWRDLLSQPHKQRHRHHVAPASQPCDVSDRTHLEDQQQLSPWSNTGGFDSGNTVTFSSSTSRPLLLLLLLSPLSSTDPFITQTGSVCFNLCSVSLEQPIWAEEEVDKERRRGRWIRDERERERWYGEVWWEVRLRRHNRDKPLWNNRGLEWQRGH